MTNQGPTAKSPGPSPRPGLGQALSQLLSLLAPKSYLQYGVLNYAVIEHLQFARHGGCTFAEGRESPGGPRVYQGDGQVVTRPGEGATSRSELGQAEAERASDIGQGLKWMQMARSIRPTSLVVCVPYTHSRCDSWSDNMRHIFGGMNLSKVEKHNLYGI